MATDFLIVHSVPDVAVTPGGDVQDVQRSTILALPSGVQFPVRVPTAGNIAGATGTMAALLASAFNAAAGVDGVVGIQASQDTDVAGNVIDVVTLYIASDSGNVVITKQVPMALFGAPAAGGLGAGSLSTLGTSDGLGFAVMPSSGGGGGTSGGFNLSGFSSAVGTWRADANALEAL